ncbi:TrkA C-terminal domain-containing protein [Halohasta salina]|uniref:TrkA C-terminal domain-containing protein n=1 Tax=Halohasta salina TaxID=2961621 RepID=UPI0020A39C90|nr:TrkA C-terminal domain-containing protein [Halohasta salina]
MAALPFEILLGIYLGVLTGIVPAAIAGALGFLFKYVTDVSIPSFGVVVLALGIAGVNGGLMALTDEQIRSAENAVVLVTAIIVVLMLALYAHARGDSLGSSLPRRFSLGSLGSRTLNTDVIELVEGRNQVRVRVDGDVGDIEGYPALSPALRSEITAGRWAFPADLPLAELERRFADRLQSAFDLAAVNVTIDRRGRATVAAAPPTGSTSRRVPAGKRAVSVAALVPTGLTRGASVRLVTAATSVAGTVIAARSTPPPADPAVETDGGEPVAPPAAPPTAATTTGGEGRVTVAVDRTAASALLAADQPQVVVAPRGTRREFELVGLLRRSGVRFATVTLAPDSEFAGHTIGDLDLRDRYGAVIVAAKGDHWQLAPDTEYPLSTGDSLYLAGSRQSLAAVREAAE